MQKVRAIIFFFTVIFLCNAFLAEAQEKQGWTLVWQDEFNYTGLPDAKKWRYETGHIRNDEQQYYTNARKENVWVNNGMLTMTGRKEVYPNQFYKKGSADWQYKDSTAQYTSASVNTEGLAGWQYGRIEVKAKLPSGPGIWPAIWMLPDNPKIAWPASGEIDIMEFIGNHPADLYGTIHFGDTAAGKHASSGSKILDTTLNNKFHIYGIEWTRQAIDIYFDDSIFHHFVIDAAGPGDDNPFRKKFYLLLNLAMGAEWPGPIDDAVLPRQYLVDYVRVYKKNEQ